MILQSIKLIKSNILVDELDEVTVSLKSEKTKGTKQSACGKVLKLTYLLLWGTYDRENKN